MEKLRNCPPSILTRNGKRNKPSKTNHNQSQSINIAQKNIENMELYGKYDKIQKTIETRLNLF